MEKSRIILVTGGQRSGKSVFAENLALRLSPTPVYIATAQVLDDEFRHRVAIHQQRRGPQWTNIEEPLSLSRLDVNGRTVLIDCVTLWATNMFFANGDDIDAAARAMKEEFDKFTSQNATFIFVTTETGLGGTSENPMQRRFNDLQGEINQYIASKADEVHLVISGIDVKIK
ncbi:bifunctional adenosylcobinamide kinase/adenosylcobinamide-phosphate guanylyltransferase [uncultured Muribaculum sp.]|uniref:bifunctional adenosylcobinamide kinase/adenosylcobinamide-phosphate guanylyltransferase n=1 Tax=uncultured Muribaculum sp. TaxID=1918613 RepID=UPI00259A74EA|nr:bifunctional adenosylcobinamide kinase/adenosylcobinamide-phosphate guanylyltransferase [uncultured Muribaculum sp.]